MFLSRVPRFLTTSILVISAITAVTAFIASAWAADPSIQNAFQTIKLLPPGPNNPRNSEGDFIKLNDGRILFVYTHFDGGGSDHATAYLAGRFSSDGGKTWTDRDTLVVPNDAKLNIMSVSLLRLQDGRIALFYMRKDSLTDCRPVMRTSSDEGTIWSEAVQIVPDSEVNYYVLNNDRVVQLENGRLIVPVARHYDTEKKKHDWAGVVRCYLSDDAGKTWRSSKTSLLTKTPGGIRLTTQEPGVVKLKDGRLMMWSRGYDGRQYVSYSNDDGDTWSDFKPSNMTSPCSPATIERIPGTDTLLLVWNNHENIAPELRGMRTPYSIAISDDEGKTWKNAKNLYDDPYGWYCYTGLHFEGDYVLLSHCAGDRRKGGLNETHITRIPLDWITK